MRLNIVFIFCLVFCRFAQAQTANEALGDAYFQQEEFSKALSTYEEVFTIRPEKGLFEKIIQCYEFLNDYRSAEKFTKKFLKKNPRPIDFYLIELGRIQLAQGNFKEANESFGFVLEQIDNQTNTVYQSARFFEEARLLDKALEAYEIAEKKSAQYNFHYQKAQIYGELGQVNKVIDEYLLLIPSSPAYLQTVQFFLAQSLSSDENDPLNIEVKQKIVEQIQVSDNPVFSELLVWVFVQEQNFNGALRQLKALDKRMGKNQYDVYQFADVCLRNQEFATAVKSYDYITLEVGPKSEFYLLATLKKLEAQRLAFYANIKRDTLELENLLLQYSSVLNSLSVDLTTASSHREWARLLAFEKREPKIALDKIDALIQLPDPTRAELDLNLLAYADVLAFSGAYYEAILYYARVEKARPGTELADEAKFSRARVAFYQSEFEWATNLFDALKHSVSKVIANDAMAYSLILRDNVGLDTNTDALVFYARAEKLYVRRLYTEALKVLDTLQIGFFDHSLQDEALWMKANIFLEQKEFEKAVIELKLLLDKHGEDILADEALYNLGVIYQDHLYDKTLAMEYFGQLLAKHPDSFYTDAARRRIRMLRGEIIP
jgi:tetratricopeptide (TPR) repeat protein